MVAVTRVRAFEPRGEVGGWRCRGRFPNHGPNTPGKTRQCGARLPYGQTFCGRCGGLVAWGGQVFYMGLWLKHLDRGEVVRDESGQGAPHEVRYRPAG